MEMVEYVWPFLSHFFSLSLSAMPVRGADSLPQRTVRQERPRICGCSTSQTSLTSLPNSLLDWKVRSPQVVSCHTRTHYCTPLTSIPLPSCLFVVTAEAERGNWKEEMTKESTTMLYRALHNLIERSLSLLSSLLFQLPIVALSLSAQVVAE